jgi:hypothetical protein
MQMNFRRIAAVSVALLAMSSGLAAQSMQVQLNPNKPVACPGTFPTDLTVVSCTYTKQMRWERFISGSVTDQSILSAALYSVVAQMQQSPSEWGRNWEGYGRRVGSRYTQAVAKGAAEAVVGWAVHDDPRHIRYADEPQRVRAAQSTSRTESAHPGWARFGHALLDTVTVRIATQDGTGRRIPAVSRFVGDFASAYGGYGWYPARENTFQKAGQRAAYSFGASFVPSFYTEYKPEVGRLLGAMFKRGKTTPAVQVGGHP